jgi:hypothetical protein
MASSTERCAGKILVSSYLPRLPAHQSPRQRGEARENLTCDQWGQSAAGCLDHSGNPGLQGWYQPDERRGAICHGSLGRVRGQASRYALSKRGLEWLDKNLDKFGEPGWSERDRCLELSELDCLRLCISRTIVVPSFSRWRWPLLSAGRPWQRQVSGLRIPRITHPTKLNPEDIHHCSTSRGYEFNMS